MQIRPSRGKLAFRRDGFKLGKDLEAQQSWPRQGWEEAPSFSFAEGSLACRMAKKQAELTLQGNERDEGILTNALLCTTAERRGKNFSME